MDVGFFSSLVSVPAHPRIHRPTEGRREASSGGQVSHELFGPPVDHVHGRFGRLFRALPALAMILSAGLVVIIPLAYASPTDPTWVAGIYDAADYDEVIEVLTDSNAASDSRGSPRDREPHARREGDEERGPRQRRCL